MRRLEKTIWNNRYGVMIFLITLSLFLYKGIFNFLSVESMAGHDLIGNYAFAWLMNGFMKDLSFSGWSNLWFAGFPAFYFYPPLFFISVNVLNIVTLDLIPLQMSYKLLALASLFFLPLTVFHSSRRMGYKRLESFFASVFSLSFLFLNGHYSSAHQTLNFGFVAQIFALNLLMLFFGELFRLKGRKNVFVCGILLALAILSHPFIGILGIIGLFFVVDKVNLKRIVAVASVGLVASAWWWIKVLANLRYMNIYTSSTIPISDFPVIFVPFIVASLRLERKVLFFSGLFLVSLLLGTVNLSIVAQPSRFFQYSLLFGALLAGLGGHRVYEFLADSFFMSDAQKLVLISIILLALLLNIVQEPFYKQWESGLDTNGLFNYIKTLGDGRVLVESTSDMKDYYTLMERIPMETGKPVLTELHVDSSISAPYALLLQYWVSAQPTINPVCELCRPMKVDTELIFAGLKRFNVKYVVVQSETTKNFLSGFLELRKKIDNYYVFETDYEPQYYEILSYKPIFIVSKYGQWKELNKKIFVDKNLVNLTFVWSEETPKDIGVFGQILEMGEKEEAVEFFDKMKNTVIFEKIDYNATVRDFQYSDRKISFTIDSEMETPVLLKFSYFPNWKKESVYMASPSLIMVHGKGKVELEFSTLSG